MKLSIITINRNNAEGLKKTIESVVFQTFNDLEYIIIDGASTDDSINIIKQYEDRITYWLSEPDTGVYQAMNKGILNASGQYLLFLNSGDFLVDNTVLERVFEGNIYADILCAKCNVSDKGKVVWTSNPPEQISLYFLYKVGLAHQSTFVKKTLFEKYGLYREDFRYNSDIEFWYRTIIYNDVTTQRIDVVTTDYNLDGISAHDKYTTQYLKEKDEILSHPYLRRVIPDFLNFEEREKESEMWRWAKGQRMIRLCVEILYRMAIKLNR